MRIVSVLVIAFLTVLAPGDARFHGQQKSAESCPPLCRTDPVADVWTRQHSVVFVYQVPEHGAFLLMGVWREDFDGSSILLLPDHDWDDRFHEVMRGGAIPVDDLVRQPKRQNGLDPRLQPAT